MDSNISIDALRKVVRNIGNDMIKDELNKNSTSTNNKKKRKKKKKKHEIEGNINRMILEKKFLQMLHTCCVEFIEMVASESGDVCFKDGNTKGQMKKRKYVNADFVIRALDDLGVTEYKEYVVKQVKAVILPEESDFRLKKNTGSSSQIIRKKVLVKHEETTTVPVDNNNNNNNVKKKIKKKRKNTSTTRRTYNVTRRTYNDAFSKKISRNEAKARAKKKRKFFKKKLTPEEEAQLAAEQEQLFQKYAPLKSTKREI